MQTVHIERATQPNVEGTLVIARACPGQAHRTHPSEMGVSGTDPYQKGLSRTDPSQMGVSDGPVRDMPVQSQGCLQHSVDLLSRYLLSALPRWIMCAARRVLLDVFCSACCSACAARRVLLGVCCSAYAARRFYHIQKTCNPPPCTTICKRRPADDNERKHIAQSSFTPSAPCSLIA